MTEHWSNTKPPGVVLLARFAAVMELPSSFGEMVLLRKYPKPEPTI
jgi:hypothetical protein